MSVAQVCKASGEVNEVDLPLLVSAVATGNRGRNAGRRSIVEGVAFALVAFHVAVTISDVPVLRRKKEEKRNCLDIGWLGFIALRTQQQVVIEQ